MYLFLVGVGVLTMISTSVTEPPHDADDFIIAEYMMVLCLSLWGRTIGYFKSIQEENLIKFSLKYLLVEWLAAPGIGLIIFWIMRAQGYDNLESYIGVFLGSLLGVKLIEFFAKKYFGVEKWPQDQ